MSTTESVLDRALLVSGFGDARFGGGLFLLAEGGAEQIDDLGTTGLRVAGDRLLRLLRNPAPDGAGELLVYDASGVRSYIRLDGAADAHDVLWDGEHYVVAGTGANAIQWYSTDGELVRVWKPRGEADSWHINGVVLDGGVLYACAFGHHRRFREWVSAVPRARGEVFPVDGDGPTLRGLERPHTPRRHQDSWYVCNSYENAVAEFDVRGRLLRQIPLAGWTRGMVVTDTYLHVGESASRGSLERSAVARVARESGRVLDRMELTCDEIYDIAAVPWSLVDGARTGFNTNAQRVAERRQRSMLAAAGVETPDLWVVGYRIEPPQCAVDIEAVVPERAAPCITLDVSCTVRNRSTALLVSAPPYPVCVSYEWHDARGTVITGPADVPLRTLLPGGVPPGQVVAVTCKVRTPAVTGTCRLVVTLVQEEIRWFHHIDVANGSWHTVDVIGSAPEYPEYSGS